MSEEPLFARAYCPSCRAQRALAGPFDLRCPVCGTPTPEIVAGRELELTAVEVVDAPANRSGPEEHPEEEPSGRGGPAQSFPSQPVFVTSLVSSPGAGKTAFLEALLERMHPEMRVAALVGDLATECDAQRLSRTGAPVRQITTGTVCHLDAEMIETALNGWPLSDIDWLFIEGNLVCPPSYDLGEHLRLVLVSVTEGEDKPLTYPTVFNTADLAIVTKIDLVHTVDFDLELLLRNLQSVRPGPRCSRSLRTRAPASTVVSRPCSSTVR